MSLSEDPEGEYKKLITESYLFVQMIAKELEKRLEAYPVIRDTLVIECS
jgi:hypothetical protein